MAVKRYPLDEAIASIRRGDLVIFPTDTVYGIAARPDDPAATARLFAAKHRTRDLQLPILAASVDAARAVGTFDARADRLAVAFWPGALTLVLPRSEGSLGWALGGDADTVAIRVPRHPLALAVLAATGPLATSSANRSGAPPAGDADALERAFEDAVAVYLCQDAPLAGAASSVVDLAHGPARLLRAGAAEAEAIATILGPEDALLDSPLSP